MKFVTFGPKQWRVLTVQDEHVETRTDSRIVPRGSGLGSPNFESGRFSDRPLLVFWETTKACSLACAHCRADAQHAPGPDDLTFDEGRALIDELAAIGAPRPILVLTGGDCLERVDIVSLLAHAQIRRVPVALAPSVTGRLTDEMLDTAKNLGVKTISVSLDGARPGTHDTIRRVPGHFLATLAAIDRLHRHGFTVQVNTTVMTSNVEELAEIFALVHYAGVEIWEVFFLINTGRGSSMLAPDAEANEDISHFLVDASRYGVTIRTVEGPFFRRVARERALIGLEPPEYKFSFGPLYYRLRDELVKQLGVATHEMRAPSAATRDGQGIIFVANNGDIFPSGFLPWRVGNVREGGLLHSYRSDPLLRAIRAGSFDGACATCLDTTRCGGSRARAFASSGNPLGEDPGCVLTLKKPVTIMGTQLHLAAC